MKREARITDDVEEERRERGRRKRSMEEAKRQRD